MLAADVARLLAAAALAVLALTGALELWHVVVLVAVYGTGQAFFAPAFDAIVPGAAARPSSSRRPTRSTSSSGRSRCGMAGPALGGVLVGAFGAGVGVRARRGSASRVSAVALLLMRPPAAARRRAAAGSLLADLREGWRFVRERRWLWVDVRQRGDRLPAVHGAGRGARAATWSSTTSRAARRDLGLVFAAGGLASIASALVLGTAGCRAAT